MKHSMHNSQSIFILPSDCTVSISSSWSPTWTPALWAGVNSSDNVNVTSWDTRSTLCLHYVTLSVTLCTQSSVWVRLCVGLSLTLSTSKYTSVSRFVCSFVHGEATAAPQHKAKMWTEMQCASGKKCLKKPAFANKQSKKRPRSIFVVNFKSSHHQRLVHRCLSIKLNIQRFVAKVVLYPDVLFQSQYGTTSRVSMRVPTKMRRWLCLRASLLLCLRCQECGLMGTPCRDLHIMKLLGSPQRDQVLKYRL